jgi:hypothetical protein
MRYSSFVRGFVFFILIHLVAYKAWGQIQLTDATVQRILSPAEKEKNLELETFFAKMGYNRDEVVRNIVAQNHITEAELIAQQTSRYEVIEISKKLASFILTKAVSKLPNDRVEARLNEVISRFLTFGIRGLPSELSPELLAITDPIEKQQKISEYLKNYLTMAMSELRTGLMTDIFSIFYTASQVENFEREKNQDYLQKKQVLNEILSRLLVKSYSDLQLSPTRLVGRAMALGLVREARLQGRTDLEQKLGKAIEEKGGSLENFISAKQTAGKDEITINTDSLVTVEKADLSLGLSHSDNTKSAVLSFLVNQWRKLKYRWTSLSLTGKIQVKSDSKSGLETVWVYADSPNPVFTDLAGFAPKGVTKKFILDQDGKRFKIDRLATVGNLSAKARQYLYYGATRAPLDARMMKILDHGIEPVEMPTELFTGLMTKIIATPEFKTLLDQKSDTPTETGNYVTSRELKTQAMNENEMREFLAELGFEDLSGQTKDYYKKGNTYSLHTQAQQVRNTKSYGAMNASRELAILLMNQMQSRLGSAEGRTQLAKLSATLLSQQPMDLVEKIPIEIIRLPEGEERDKAFDLYVAGITREAMDIHNRVLTSQLMTTIYGDEKLKSLSDSKLTHEETVQMTQMIGRIYLLSATIIERMYMDAQVGQTRYLGRAFLGLLARAAEVNKDSEIILAAKSEALKSGYRIENFIGDTWYMDGDHGVERVPITNMSYVLTRNINPESVTIPFGAIPSDTAKGKEMGLMGNPIAAALVVTPDMVKNGYSNIDEWKDKAFYKYAKDGFSHIGYVQIRKAKRSGIKMSWMVDNYPHIATDSDRDIADAPHDAGGLRFVGLEQFFLTSHHSRMMVATPNPLKFFNYAQQQVKEKGIPQTGAKFFPFPTYKVQLDEQGKPVEVKSRSAIPQDWTITTPQAVLNDLYSEKDPARFMEKYNQLVAEGFKENIRKGMTFIWVTPYARYFYGGAYCSSTGEIVSGQTTGLSIEPLPTRWNPLVKWVGSSLYGWALKHKIKFITKNEALTDIWKLNKLGMIAPSSLAAQPFIDDFTHVDAPVKNITKRTLNDFSMQVNQNPINFKILSKVLDFNMGSFFAKMKLDRQEVRAVSISVEHASEVNSGSLNVVKAELKEQEIRADENTSRTAKKIQRNSVKHISVMTCEKVMLK